MPKPGLNDNSDKTVEIVKEGNKYYRYEVVETAVDLTPLERELSMLETMPKPLDKEVLELAKKGIVHDYYSQRGTRINQLKQEINFCKGV